MTRSPIAEVLRGICRVRSLQRGYEVDVWLVVSVDRQPPSEWGSGRGPGRHEHLTAGALAWEILDTVEETAHHIRKGYPEQPGWTAVVPATIPITWAGDDERSSRLLAELGLDGETHVPIPVDLLDE